MMGSTLNEQNSPECIKFYENYSKTKSKYYLTLNGLGNFYLKTGQFEKALEYYNKAISVDGKRSAKIYKNRAYLLEKQKGIQKPKKILKII